MAISGYVGQNTIAWNQLAALALLMSAPVVSLFLLLQRTLLSGLLIGVQE